MADDGKLRVVMVCSGNICRSPMAAAVFRTHLAKAGLADAVDVSSAGTGPWHAGEPADPRAAATLEANGYPTEHVAAQLNPNHVEADLLLAADSGHLRDLRRVADPAKVALLRDFDPTAPDGAEIPDPYYGEGGSTNGFADVLGMIERAMPALLDWVREHR